MSFWEGDGGDSAGRYRAFLQEREAKKAEALRKARGPHQETPEMTALLHRAEHGDVAAMRCVAFTLAEQRGFRIVEDAGLRDVYGYFDWLTGTAVVVPVKDSAAYMTTLHELGHGIAGRCPEREPHRPRSTGRWWECQECERLAYV